MDRIQSEQTKTKDFQWIAMSSTKKNSLKSVSANRWSYHRDKSYHRTYGHISVVCNLMKGNS